MKRPLFRLLCRVLCRLLCGLGFAWTLLPAFAADAATRWTASWVASPQPVWQGDFVLPTGLPFQFHGQTVRQTLRLSVGGARMRVVIGNEDGIAPLHVGAASLARAAAGSAIDPASVQELRFGGQPEVIVPSGGRAVSDAVRVQAAALSRWSVSLYLPGPTAPASFHWDARDTAFIAAGNLASAARLPDDAARMGTRVFLSGVLVDGDRGTGAVVVLGDSITDGNGATPGADRRWPDVLAERLAPLGVPVLNAGISGNRLLADGMGRSALARVERDAFAQPGGVRALVVLLGINDIGWPGSPFAPHERPVTAQQLILGYRQLIALARAHNALAVGATLTPFEGALSGTPLEGHYSADKERVRQDVNRWIRESGEFDAVVDADRVLRDPGRPSRLQPGFDSGDHLHPGDAGYRALAEAVDLGPLIAKQPSSAAR